MKKNKLLFNKMLKRQEYLNNLTYPAWKEKLGMYDWQSAVLVEAGELLESFGYKWWKKQEKDMENVRVELIDILHFMLSDLHYCSLTVKEEASEKFVSALCESKLDIPDDYMFKYNVLHLVAMGIKDITEQFFNLGKLFKYVGMRFEEVYKSYFIKNVLNEFRQKNGYKNGTYIKIWRVDIGEGLKDYEDNQVVFAIAEKIPLEEIDERLMDEIELIYKKVRFKYPYFFVVFEKKKLSSLLLFVLIFVIVVLLCFLYVIFCDTYIICFFCDC